MAIIRDGQERMDAPRSKASQHGRETLDKNGRGLRRQSWGTAQLERVRQTGHSTGAEIEKRLFHRDQTREGVRGSDPLKRS